MDENEDYVRASWNTTITCRTSGAYGDDMLYEVFIGGGLAACGWFNTKLSAWNSAAELTRNRQEEIRQVDEQWTLIGAQSLEWYGKMEREDPWTNRRLFWARGFVQFQMVLARLEAIRDELKRGLKP